MPVNLNKRELSLSLYEIEDGLQVLLDVEHGELTPEVQAQHAEAVLATLDTAVDKREKVGRFILAASAKAAFLKAEAKRLSDESEFLDRTVERVKGYVLQVIHLLGRDDKGKYKRLEGHTLRMRAHANAASVEIKDLAAVPDNFKRVTISMPADVFAVIYTKNKEMWESLASRNMFKVVEEEAMKTAIKTAMEAGVQVPGAELIVGKDHLRVE